jgi:hypothetical protein
MQRKLTYKIKPSGVENWPTLLVVYVDGKYYDEYESTPATIIDFVTEYEKAYNL